MTAASQWLASREPSPPGGLRSSLSALTLDDDAADDGSGLPDVLAAAARQRLEEALATPGRVRASAFRLLEADALLTYACEAALEAEDPGAGLRRLLGSAGG